VGNNSPVVENNSSELLRIIRVVHDYKHNINHLAVKEGAGKSSNEGKRK
jgi:hypothetical protein